MARPDTPDTPDVRYQREDGQWATIAKVKRGCNGCGQRLGDITEDEVLAAIDGRPLSDVRHECPTCGPAMRLADGLETLAALVRDNPVLAGLAHNCLIATYETTDEWEAAIEALAGQETAYCGLYAQQVRPFGGLEVLIQTPLDVAEPALFPAAGEG